MANVKLSNVIRRAQTKVDKDDTDLVFYVGGEHIESENIRVHSRGIIAESTIGPMFYYGFKAGDFLLVSRNPHLKKAGLVDFDGICSEKTFVLETANSDVLLPEFLPFVLQNERFWDYAYRHRHGSTNTFINWSTLANYEFELPDLETQRKLAEVLWSINDTMEAYKNLISATDELVKSQFFGEFEAKRQSFSTCSLIAACENEDDIKCGPFGTQLKQSEYTEEGVPVWGIPQVNAAFSIPADTYVSEEKALQLTPFLIQPDDIAMSRKGNIGQCALYPADYTPGIIASDVLRIRPDKTKLLPSFLMCQLHYSSNVVNQIEMVGNGQIMKGINVTKLKNITIYIPPMELQEQFAAFVRQSDKSKLLISRLIAWKGGLL